MQGLGPWVESSPHWKQSKFIQNLLPYAPMASEVSKDVASEAWKQMKSEEGSQQPSVSDPVKSRSEHSTNNPFN